MILEALQYLFDRAVAAKSAQDVETQNPRVEVFNIGGVLHTLDVPVGVNPAAGTLDDLIEMVKDSAIAPDPEVYVGSDRIVAVLDRADRYNEAEFAPELTTLWEKLVGHQSPRAYDVSGIVDLLRHDLHGEHVTTLLPAVRRIDFTRTSSGHASKEHGRESLGKAVEAVVQQADQIPEEFTVDVSPYRGAGVLASRHQITVRITIAPETQKIVLRTSVDEMEAALMSVREATRTHLASKLEGVPVFCGSP